MLRNLCQLIHEYWFYDFYVSFFDEIRAESIITDNLSPVE